jgi:hypothetical protein
MRSAHRSRIAQSDPAAGRNLDLALPRRVTLFFAASAYLVYVWRSGLANRNTLKKTRVMVMPVASKMRFGGLNVLLHWAAYLIVLLMTVTGVILYFGFGGWIVSVHSYVAFIGLAYVFIHAIAHYLYGGWWQVFRVFRPAKLALTAAVKPKPLLIAGVAGLVVAAGVVAADWATRDTLIVTRVEGEPKLDGILDEAMWNRARPVTIHTQQGENFGGPGESTSSCAPCTTAKGLFRREVERSHPLAAPPSDDQERGRLARDR